jgi:hypothetical protein
MASRFPSLTSSWTECTAHRPRAIGTGHDIAALVLFFQSELMGTTSGESITHDPVAHKHLRLRHDTAPDQIVWETSPDGSTWVERRRIARPFPVSTLRAEIEGGTYRAETESGEVLVDDFVFAR